MKACRLIIIFLALALMTPTDGNGHAGNLPGKGQARSATAEANAPPLGVLSPDQHSLTSHVLELPETTLSYVAHAGVLPVRTGREKPECRIFFVSYALQGKGPRPVSFVFNGGPGASSAYLHLAALGPRRVQFTENGGVPGPVPRFTDNPHTWLGFTDLVFIDPVGTGYSRCLTSENGQTREQPKGNPWGVKEDLEALASFIRLYLTRHRLWLSPKFLIGESYGGLRVAALSYLLQSEYGIGLNGLVMVSPALEFAHLGSDDFLLLPWVVTLPSYAATARFHGKADGSNDFTEKHPRQGLADVEGFALRELLPALAQGAASRLCKQVSSYIGLPADVIARMQSRIPPRFFAQELLRDKGRLISLYDGTRTAPNPEPSGLLAPREDFSLLRINTFLAAGLNSYVRETLKFETDIPYEVLNKDVYKNWKWRSGLQGEQGFVGAAGDLKRSLTLSKGLKAFIAHGVFDLVTPYFGSIILKEQMSLDPAVDSSLRLEVYGGGHMFYTHEDARGHFFKDAQGFFSE